MSASSSSSRSLSQHKPKNPSKLRKSVTAKTRSNSSDSASASASAFGPPPPPPLPVMPSFTSMKPKHPKEKESYISTGPRSIFSKDNPRGFLEIKGERGVVSQLTAILDEDGNTKTYTHKMVQKLNPSEINDIRKENERLREIILRNLGISKKGGKKTHKHRKGKGKSKTKGKSKKAYKPRTLRKRK